MTQNAFVVVLQSTLEGLKGEVSLTREMTELLNALSNSKVPRQWLYSPNGDERSWLAPNLAIWFRSLQLRDQQLRSWLIHVSTCLGQGLLHYPPEYSMLPPNPSPFVFRTRMQGRPRSFWLGGFCNPQGLLSAIKQESVRASKDAIALDDMELLTLPTPFNSSEEIKSTLPEGEGAFIHGLYLEGAGYEDKALTEAPPNVTVYTPSCDACGGGFSQ